MRGVGYSIIQIIFYNVRISPLIVIPNISGLLRPRVLNHYTTRASRNEVSNVGAIEVGLHSYTTA